jgi:hypothetical protein
LQQQAAAAGESYRTRLQDLANAAQLAAAADAAKVDGGGSGGAGSGSGMAVDTAAAAAGVQPPGGGKVYDLKHSGWWGSGQVRCRTVCMLDDKTQHTHSVFVIHWK